MEPGGAEREACAPLPSCVLGPRVIASAPRPFPSLAPAAPPSAGSPAPSSAGSASPQKAETASPPSAESSGPPTAPVAASPASSSSPASSPQAAAAPSETAISAIMPAYPARGAVNDSSPRHRNHQRRHRRKSTDKEKNYSTKEDPLKVVVTGYPHYSQPQDLLRVFAKYGTVKLESINNRCAVFAYRAPDDASEAVKASKKANVYGEFLTVRRFSEARQAELTQRRAESRKDFSRIKQEEPPSPVKETPAMNQTDELVDPQQLELSGSFSEQLERLLARVRLTQEDVAALSVLYTDLETALQHQWPGCKAIPFGSITTGLGVRSSDADCFVHVPAQFRHPHANFVNKAKRLLQQYPDVFADVLAIPRANTPIVKLFHVPTRTRADVTFKTPLGAQNSKLVAALLHADERLLPAAVALKYWARVHGLSGSGRLTNYALTLLLLFYLQQPPALLPPVQRLQRRAPLLVDHWDTSFAPPEPPEPPADAAPASVADLIGGFFEFYAAFDFETLAVCPFVGVPLRKELFAEPALLPEPYARYRANVAAGRTPPLRADTPLCVQDPFEQCHNVAAGVAGRLAAELRAQLQRGAAAYARERPACAGLLRAVLLQRAPAPRRAARPEYRVNLFPRIIVTIVDPDWKPVVRDLVFVIFEKMLKIKLGKVEEKVNLDTQKQKEKYMGSVTRGVWKRKQYARAPHLNELAFLERQATITDDILQRDAEPVSVQFQLTLTFCQEPRSAVLAIKLGAGDVDAFRDFGKFFISVMQGWFMNLLRPYARPPEQDTAAKIADTLHDAPPDSLATAPTAAEVAAAAY